MTKYTLMPREANGLCRIKALRSFGDVREGDLGGYIEGEHNLSHEGTSWIYDNAQVRGHAWVGGHAGVYDNARVEGNARVGGSARVVGFSRVGDNARVGMAAQDDDYEWINA